jgi:hypothetical protein
MQILEVETGCSFVHFLGVETGSSFVHFLGVETGSSFVHFLAGTKNEICVSLVYSGNGNEILFTFPLYTRETQISFLVAAC